MWQHLRQNCLWWWCGFCVECSSIVEEEFRVIELLLFGLTSGSWKFSIVSATVSVPVLSAGTLQIMLSIRIKLFWTVLRHWKHDQEIIKWYKERRFFFKLGSRIAIRKIIFLMHDALFTQWQATSKWTSGSINESLSIFYKFGRQTTTIPFLFTLILTSRKCRLV